MSSFTRWFPASLLCLLTLMLVSSQAEAQPVYAHLLARGVNLSHWLSRYYEDPGDYDTADFAGCSPCVREKDLARIREAGFTHVRIPVDPWMLQQEWATIEHVDSALAWCFRNNLATIVDLHTNRPPDLREPLEYELYEQMWLVLVDRYRAHPLGAKLFYELMNEPGPENGSASEWRASIDKLVQAIRRRDLVHPLVVCGAQWSSPNDLTDLGTVHDANVVYTFHFYWPLEYTHQGANWVDEWSRIRLGGLGCGPTYPREPDWVSSAVLRELRAAVAFRRLHPDVAIYCGEFGVYKACEPARRTRSLWLRDVRKALEANRIGWCVWTYKDEGFGIFEGEEIDPSVRLALGLDEDSASDDEITLEGELDVFARQMEEIERALIGSIANPAPERPDTGARCAICGRSYANYQGVAGPLALYRCPSCEKVFCKFCAKDPGFFTARCPFCGGQVAWPEDVIVE